MTDDVVAVLQRAKERLVEHGWMREPLLAGHDKRLCVGLAFPQDVPDGVLCDAVEILNRSLGLNVHDYHRSHVWWNDNVCVDEAMALDAFDAAILPAKDARP